jgi:transcriptional regulator with XRE-family HTH domain
MTKVFNYLALYIALNKTRKQRGITWHKVATRAGISPSGMHNFVRQFEEEFYPPKALSLENFVKLMAWMNKTDIGEFMMDKEDAL